MSRRWTGQFGGVRPVAGIGALAWLACAVLAVGRTAGGQVAVAAVGAATSEPAPASRPTRAEVTPGEGAGGAPYVAPPAVAAPTTHPTFSVPPGFVRIEVDGRGLLVAPEDEAWVRQAAHDVGVAARPTTMPEDLLSAVAGRHGDISARLATDLAVDAKATDEWVDGSGDRTLRGVLQQFVDSRMYVLFLVVSEDRARDLVRSGWATPGLEYNRQMNEVFRARRMEIAGEPDAPSVIQPLVYDARAVAEADRGAWLKGQVSEFDRRVSEVRAEDGMKYVQQCLVYFISAKGFENVELKPDQEWLRVGVVGSLTAKYASLITGVQRRLIIQMMTHEQRGMLRMTAVDLLSPLDPKDMVPAFIPDYAGAVRRKSVKIVDELTLKAGDDSIGKIMAAVKEKKPADGAALVALVREITGVDLTAQLRSGQ